MLDAKKMLARGMLLLAALAAVACAARFENRGGDAAIPAGNEAAAAGNLAGIAVIGQGTAMAGAVSKEDATAAPEAESRCLKGGELCNPLNDRCCAGYYCFGGLVPTCFIKP